MVAEIAAAFATRPDASTAEVLGDVVIWISSVPA